MAVVGVVNDDVPKDQYPALLGVVPSSTNRLALSALAINLFELANVDMLAKTPNHV
jgi:hypothetical protein